MTNFKCAPTPQSHRDSQKEISVWLGELAIYFPAGRIFASHDVNIFWSGNLVLFLERSKISEPVTRWCSLTILQNSQENNWVGESIWIKLLAVDLMKNTSKRLLLNFKSLKCIFENISLSFVCFLPNVIISILFQTSIVSSNSAVTPKKAYYIMFFFYIKFCAITISNEPS